MADIQKALSKALDDFDEWAGVHPGGYSGIDAHGAHLAKLIELLRAALTATDDAITDARVQGYREGRLAALEELLEEVGVRRAVAERILRETV